MAVKIRRPRLPTRQPLLDAMPVSHRLKLIYIHIPKCAGTSVIQTLQRHDPALEYIGAASLEQRLTLKTEHLHHATAKALASALPPATWQSYFKTGLVRNPWDRMVSYYHYRLRQPPQIPSLWKTSQLGACLRHPKHFVMYAAARWKMRSSHKRMLRDSASPLGFHNWLHEQLANPHFCHHFSCRQYVTDAAGNNLLDFTARYHHLREDFAILSQRLGVDLDLPQANTSAHRDYRTYYTPELREFVGDRFRDDVKFFGFEF